MIDRIDSKDKIDRIWGQEFSWTGLVDCPVIPKVLCVRVQSHEHHDLP